MRSPLLLSLCLTVAFAGGCSRESGRPIEPTPAVPPQRVSALERLPIAFVPNQGQWPRGVCYVASFGAMVVFLEEQGWSFTLVEPSGGARAPTVGPPSAAARGAAVRMTFGGAGTARLDPERPLPGCHHYLLGDDPAKWRRDVPLYGGVRYCGLHDGIDVRAREHDGHFEFDLLLAPGANLDRVEVGVEGAEPLDVDASGALVMTTPLGPVRMPAPTSWEVGHAGERLPVACAYVLRGPHRFGFEVHDRRAERVLVVDPGLVWSTYLGGSTFDAIYGVALDAQGATTVVGWTLSPDFLTTPGAFSTAHQGLARPFVTKLSPTGSTLVYSTFFGGSGADYAVAMALDAQGAATVGGWTNSPDFPTTPGAYSTTPSGSTDAFVLRLDATGSGLVYSTRLGGAGNDYVTALALDAQGSTTVAGQTVSTTFPTTAGALATSYGGGNFDAFVARLSPTGSSLVYATYLGGAGDEGATGLCLSPQGEPVVVGQTTSSNFPTTPASHDPSYNGGPSNGDAFVARLSSTGASLVFSTFLGGSDSDIAFAVACDRQGAITVAGATFSLDFPTTPGAFDTTHHGHLYGDAFVTRLVASGSGLVFSTFLGGGSIDSAHAVVVDALGATTITGQTLSADYPVTVGAFDTNFNLLASDAVVTRLSPSGASLYYSTFLGGTAGEGGRALAVDALGTVTVGGSTRSNDFPTTPGAFATIHVGDTGIGFVARLDLLPTDVVAFGTSSPGCSGPLPITVTSMPSVGNTAFALTSGNAAPNTVGVFAAAGAGLPSPLPVFGVGVWIDPTTLLITATVVSDALGVGSVPMPIPNNPTLAGLQFFAQFLWLSPTTAPPCPPLGWSATPALGIVIQP
jgi:hypothetical protein